MNTSSKVPQTQHCLLDLQITNSGTEMPLVDLSSLQHRDRSFLWAEYNVTFDKFMGKRPTQNLGINRQSS